MAPSTKAIFRTTRRIVIKDTTNLLSANILEDLRTINFQAKERKKAQATLLKEPSTMEKEPKAP